MEDNNNSDIVLYSGFLTKQGGTVHNWKIRWFILKKDTLSYYVTNVNWEKQRPRGIIYLNKDVEITEIDMKNRKYCFAINPHLDKQSSSSSSSGSGASSPLSTSPNGNNTLPQLFPANNTPTRRIDYDDDDNVGHFGCLPVSSAANTQPQNRIYYITAQTVFDQKKWIEKLRDAINQYSSNNSTQPQPIYRKPISDQISNSLQDMATGWKRKDSFTQSPTLLNRRYSIESVNNSIKVSLSKRKFYFNHENLTVPELSFVDIPSPPTNAIRKASSPFYSPVTHLSPTSSLSSTSSTASASASTTSSPSTSTSPQPQSPESPPISPNLASANKLSNNNNNNNTSISPPNSQSKQPKILVHHLARDSFQISNLGTCPVNFEILSPFDINYSLTFNPSSGSVAIGEVMTVSVELLVYEPVQTDIYSTLHVRGGADFTLFCRVDSDPYLPLFLRACNGIGLSESEQATMYQLIKDKPSIMKRLQETAHQMIANGQNTNPKVPIITLPRYIHSGVRISKYALTFSRHGEQSANIYQLLTEKFLISNVGQTDIRFHFHQSNPKPGQFNLSLVPTNGTLSKGEWFYVKCSMTVFEQIEVNEIIQLIINQREVHYILVKVRCDNIHPGNKEIDLEAELTMQDMLGTGAAGDVYRALISTNNLKNHLTRVSYEKGNWIRRHPSDSNIMVAVKKLHQFVEPSQEMIQDFYSEVKVLSMLNHPNIVKYVGGCTKIGNWAIVMEYLPGGNLMDVLADRIVEIPYKLILRMALDIAQGLHYLHSLGIWHLDLKSPNLLVASLSLKAAVHIKVADFNTCINKSRLTGIFANGNAKKGTTLWMAPEVIKGGVYSEKCDVYSYGVILWEMITRKLPYDDITFNCEIERQVLEGRRPDIPLDCPEEYAALMKNCWDQSPEKRPLFDQIIHQLSHILMQYEMNEQKAKASTRGLRRNHSGSSLFVAPSMDIGSHGTPEVYLDQIQSKTNKPDDIRKSKIRVHVKRQSSDSSFLNTDTSLISTNTRGSSILPFKFSPPSTPQTSFKNNNNNNNNNNMISIPLPNETNNLNIPTSITSMKAGTRKTIRFNPSFSRVDVRYQVNQQNQQQQQQQQQNQQQSSQQQSSQQPPQLISRSQPK